MLTDFSNVFSDIIFKIKRFRWDLKTCSHSTNLHFLTYSLCIVCVFSCFKEMC